MGFLKYTMKKFEFADESKALIIHNLDPKMLIRVLKLESPNNYQSQDLTFDDIFDEIFIRGWHFVFLLESSQIDLDEVEDFSHIRSILRRAGRWYKSQVVAGFIPLEKYTFEAGDDEDDIFKLMKGENPHEWLVAHKEFDLIIEFQQGKFNETQKITNFGKLSENDFMKVTRILREIGDWLSINHIDKI